jgi:hypothetical protein
MMDELSDALKKFRDIPLKKGLDSSKTDDKEILKQTNTILEEVSSLLEKLIDLKSSVKKVKPKGNSRFAHKVVARFLESSNNLLIH